MQHLEEMEPHMEKQPNYSMKQFVAKLTKLPRFLSFSRKKNIAETPIYNRISGWNTTECRCSACAKLTHHGVMQAEISDQQFHIVGQIIQSLFGLQLSITKKNIKNI